MSAAHTLSKTHYWASLALLVTVFVIAITGLLLALKKDFAVFQPPTRDGTGQGLPDRPMTSLITSINAVPGYAKADWRDIDPIDIRPKDGIAKVVMQARQEIQVDLFSGKATASGFRTSDMLESIHDFSFMGGWAKYVLFGSDVALLDGRDRRLPVCAAVPRAPIQASAQACRRVSTGEVNGRRTASAFIFIKASP